MRDADEPDHQDSNRAEDRRALHSTPVLESSARPSLTAATTLC